MLGKAKKIATKTASKAVSKTGLFSSGPEKHVNTDSVGPARAYIKAYWKKLERSNTKDNQSLLGLPKPYLVPASEEGHEFDFEEMYYWDSYFMVQGMMDLEHKELVMGILENLVSEYNRFKIIPNASRNYLMGRSQPPLLTTFIFDVYSAYDPGREWLEAQIAVAKDEYETVWMGTAKPNWRQVHEGLSRYYDINMLHDLAEAESGWDMTPRFNRKALNYLPVDLNALLYKYEMDFAKAARLFGDKREIAKWELAAKTRAKKMNELMWDKTRGLFYDYNYVKKKTSNVSSLAAYFPMWAGMVDGRQAAAMVKALRRFENKGGLATTDALPLAQYVPGALPTQWAYPNGWAPLQYIVIKGLQRYGYNDDARRIALKWIKANTDWFMSHAVFLEKYNVVSPDKPPVRGLYPSQTGFGWTNAVYERLCQEYVDDPHQILKQK